MDFFVEKQDLLKELIFVRSAVEKRATIPVLSHFLLEAVGFELRISATDLEIAARTACPAKVKTKGSAVVPGLRFLDIIRSATEGEIRCRALENNWVNVTYQRFSFKLVGLPKEDFPQLPRAPEPLAKIDAALLADSVEKTAAATVAHGNHHVPLGEKLGERRRLLGGRACREARPERCPECERERNENPPDSTQGSPPGRERVDHSSSLCADFRTILILDTNGIRAAAPRRLYS